MNLPRPVRDWLHRRYCCVAVNPNAALHCEQCGLTDYGCLHSPHRCVELEWHKQPLTKLTLNDRRPISVRHVGDTYVYTFDAMSREDSP